MEGTPLDKLKKEVNQAFDVGNNRAEMIARTETNRAANVGRLQGFQKAGVKGKKVFSAHIDDRTSPICKRLDGQKVDINEPFKDPNGEWEGMNPPVHVNCRSSWTLELEDS